MEVLKIEPISKKTDEVDLLIALRNLSTEILIGREKINDNTIPKEFKHNYIHNQITKRNKLKMIIKELSEEMERVEKSWKN